MAYSTNYTIAPGDLSNLSDKRLFVALTDDGIRLLGLNQQRETVLLEGIQFDPVHEGVQAGLESWMQDKTEWVRQWQSVHFIHHTMQALVVPAVLFGDENGRELLDCQFGDVFKGTMLTDAHKGADRYTLYRIPARQYLLLSSLHANTNHTHLLSAWIPSLEERLVPDQPCLYLLVEQERVFMALFNNGWKLMQQFEFHTPDDVSYLVLSALQQEQLDPATTAIEWSGWMDTGSALYLDLYKYMGSLRVAPYPGSFPLEERHLQGMPAHYFNPLLQAALCVS